ncbi:NADH-quinone oxidoreductase subunit J [Streptomyces sp. NPDC029526]|uniref:NADH-quinone oxidoreductase subunit J family protein n=1 Tax=Streptomyces sp. NPDC029526 TaxID=3155728 RepID=UPI0033C9B6EB
MTLAASVADLAVRTGAPQAPHLAAESHGFLSPTGVEITFLLVGLVTLGAAVITVTTRQLVHAALWLVVALGGLAVEYLLLTAEFIAWVQVLIYVGSVIVLILFGLMLTRAPIGRSPDADSGNRWFALAVAVAAAGTLVWVVVDAFRTTWIDLDGAPAGSTEVTGASLFQHWVLPFEALSVLLLAALVGAIVLSRKAKADPVRTTPADGPVGTVPGTGAAKSPSGNGTPGTTRRTGRRATATGAGTPRDTPATGNAGASKPAGTAPSPGHGHGDPEGDR